MDEAKVKNIWDLAIEASNEASLNGPVESSIVFIGSKGGGKSHLIYRLIDKSDEPKATLALEYLFTKRLRPGTSIRDVCNIYELGSGTIFTNLLDTLLTKDQLAELTVTLDTLTESLREKVETVLSKSTNQQLKELLRERSRERVGHDHEDSTSIIPYPLPLIIIGTKYDLFQELDSESKKLIATYLRSFAHSLGSSLYFTSVKSESSMNRIKNVLINIGFDTFGSKEVAPTGQQSLEPVLDYHKPLFIPFGRDSFQLIGSTNSLDSIKRKLIEKFPQTSQGVVIPDNPGRDPKFVEREIDLIKSQRDQELEIFRSRIDTERLSISDD